MNFFTNLTNTPATNFARAQYFSAVTATKDSKTYAVIDLSKRLASLATAIILLVPVINILAERILRAAGFHTPMPRPPSNGQGSASRGNGNSNSSRSNPNPQSSSSRSTSSGSSQSRQPSTTSSPHTASPSRFNPNPAAASPQSRQQPAIPSVSRESTTTSANNTSFTQIAPSSSSDVEARSSSVVTNPAAVEAPSVSLADRVRIAVSAKKGPGTKENDVYYLQIKAQPNKVDIALPTTKKEMNFVFCIDISGSMTGDRSDSVQDAMILFFTSAKQKIQQEQAQIRLSVVSFGDGASEVLNNTLLTEDNIAQIEKTVLKGVKAANQGTNIIAGLEQASIALEKMKRAHAAASTALVFLTDGTSSVASHALIPIHERLAKSSATLMALGIGDGHDEVVVEKVTIDQRPSGTSSASGAFNSIYNYIADKVRRTKTGGLTTEAAISKIFQEIANQQIDDMLCEVKGIDNATVTFLNEARKDGDAYHLGGLSSNDINVKIVRVEVPKGQNPLNNARVEITLISGKTTDKVTLAVDENEDPEILTEALKLETLAVIKACESYSLSNEDKKKKVEKMKKSLIEAGFMNEQFQCKKAELANSIASLLRLKTGLDQAAQHQQFIYTQTRQEMEDRSHFVRGRRDAQDN